MDNIKTPLIIFALILLALVGFTLIAGDPSGSDSTDPLGVISEELTTYNIDVEQVRQCIESDKYKEKVENDLKLGDSLGITGTPASLVVNRETNLGFLARGAFPAELMQLGIDALLREGTSEGQPVVIGDEPGIEIVIQKYEEYEISEEDHVKGDREAKLVLFDFSDLDCPYCAIFHKTLYSLLENNEDLAVVYKQFPIVQSHPTVLIKTYATECVSELGGEGAFWAVIDKYYSSQK